MDKCAFCENQVKYRINFMYDPLGSLIKLADPDFLKYRKGLGIRIMISGKEVFVCFDCLKTASDKGKTLALSF